MQVHQLIERIAPIGAEEPGQRAFERFSRTPELTCIAVIDARARPVGLLTRVGVVTCFADVLGRALAEKRPVSRLMSAAPIVETTDDIATLPAQLSEAGDQPLMGGFIAVENGVYAGVGTGLALLRAAAAQERATALRLQHALAAADAVVWEIDFVERRLIGAEDTRRLFGKVLTWADLDPSSPTSPILAEDRAFVIDESRPLAPQGALIQRVTAPDGGLRYVKSAWRAVYGADGAPLRVILFSTDETESRARLALVGNLVARAETALAGKAALIRGLAEDVGRTDLAEAVALAEPSHGVGGAGLSDLIGGLSRAIAELDVHDTVLKQAIDHLAVARTDALRANEAKSQFLANMSHELRTPLNAIIGYTEILLEDDAADDLRRADLGRILSASRHLLTLINEVLDLSKIEAGRMDVVVGGVGVKELLQDVVTTIQPLADKNGNTLKVTFEGEPGELRTDDVKLKQCLLNLASNACKFTTRGSVEISVRRLSGQGRDEIAFAVRDTGIGISADHLDRLFQPFMQADSSTTRRFGGTGLGLSITQRLARLLGGDIAVTSAPGAGSTFTLTIPARYGAATDEPHDGRDDGRPLVLMIEDELSARDLAGRALKRLGFSTHGVGEAAEGLRLSRDLQPDLILLDIQLPDGSGWDVLAALKADPATAGLPVVVSTIEDDRQRAIDLGACALLVKPVERDVLCATVARFARPPEPASVDCTPDLRRCVA